MLVLASSARSCSLIVWLGLLVAHGRFWMAEQRDDRDVPAEPELWPSSWPPWSPPATRPT